MPHSNRIYKQHGSLYQYTKLIRDRHGIIREYPIVAERDRAKDSHWYWGYSYIESVKGRRYDRSVSVSRSVLPLVRYAIANKVDYLFILDLCKIRPVQIIIADGAVFVETQNKRLVINFDTNTFSVA